MVDDRGVGSERGSAAFPHRPGLGRVHARDFVIAGKSFVMRAQQVVALSLGDGRNKILPVIGKYAVGAVLVEPANFPWPAQKDTTQNQPEHPLRMGLGIGERQRCAPGTAEQRPALDAKMVAESLHVRDQVPSGVVLKAGVRRRAAGAALVEEDDAPDFRVEVASMIALAPGARTAVHEQYR